MQAYYGNDMVIEDNISKEGIALLLSMQTHNYYILLTVMAHNNTSQDRQNARQRLGARSAWSWWCWNGAITLYI